MSGFEVLGVVLGTVPLVISALEHYQEGLSTIRRWRSYKSELQSLKRSLSNENAIFKNTCEKLLSGAVSSAEYKELVSEPFGVLWGSPEIEGHVTFRLDHAYEDFKDTVLDMNIALEEIQNKLGLDERGQVKWAESKAIIREIKRATFTIRRSDFEALLDRISRNNEYLLTLTNQSLDLEPKRRMEYHGNLFSQLREASRSIYRAIQNCLMCSCPGSHQVGLRLAKPEPLPLGEFSQRLHKAHFHCGVSHDTESESRPKNSAWSLIVLRMFSPPSQSPEVVSPRTFTLGKSSNTPEAIAVPIIKIDPLGRRSRNVRFIENNDHSEVKPLDSAEPYSIRCAVTASYKTTTAIALHEARGTRTLKAEVQEHHLEDPIDLCKFVRKGKYRVKAGCYGLISNSDSKEYPKFGVYTESEHEGSTSMVSLRTILEGCGGDFDPMFYADRLKLAVDISSGVLQLINTAWLQERVTSRDIMFATKNGFPVYDQTFVARKFMGLQQQIPVADRALHLRALQNIMFSLGILLSEILLFRTLDHIWDENAGQPASNVMDRVADRAVGDLRSRVQTSSPKFYSAVHCLLFFQFRLDISLGDEGFCKEVYGKTIALMEQDLKFSMS